MSKKQGPKILIMDLETSLIRTHGWGIGETYLQHDQIEEPRHLMAWSAKWLGDKKVFYEDQRNRKDVRDDRIITKKLWDLLDEAHYVIYQNGDAFDRKVANERFLDHIGQGPSAYKTIDILKWNRKLFGHPSHKLDYITNKYNKRYKKLKHKKFPGKELWLECEKGNLAAWNEMKKYNIHDVTLH